MVFALQSLLLLLIWKTTVRDALAGHSCTILQNAGGTAYSYRPTSTFCCERPGCAPAQARTICLQAGGGAPRPDRLRSADVRGPGRPPLPGAVYAGWAKPL